MTTTVPALTRKESLWLACKQKTCCYTAIVIPSGRDVWRIARALDTPPWSFLVYFETAAPRRDAFALDQSDRRFRLAFAKQTSKRTKSPPPCIFLLRTRTGHHRCGLGELRPLVCRTFPAESVDGVLCLRRDSGCTCRDWTLADVHIREEMPLVAARQADAEEYVGVVARWNSRVTAASAETPFDFVAYCQYVLESYDEIALGNGAPPVGDA